MSERTEFPAEAFAPCIGCGYALVGLASDAGRLQCPECGRRQRVRMLQAVPIGAPKLAILIGAPWLVSALFLVLSSDNRGVLSLHLVGMFIAFLGSLWTAVGFSGLLACSIYPRADDQVLAALRLWVRIAAGGCLLAVVVIIATDLGAHPGVGVLTFLGLGAFWTWRAGLRARQHGRPLDDSPA